MHVHEASPRIYPFCSLTPEGILTIKIENSALFKSVQIIEVIEEMLGMDGKGNKENSDVKISSLCVRSPLTLPQLIALVDLVKRQNRNLSFLTEIVFDKATIEVNDDYEGSIASHYVAQLFDLVDLDNL